MQSIESFMTEWSNRENVPSTPLTNKRAKVYNGLQVEITQSARANTLRINYIKSTNPKKGEMKKFLKWIVATSDNSGFTLTMAAQPTGRHFEDTPSKDKLKTIVEKFGFSSKFEYPDKNGYEMVRTCA